MVSAADRASAEAACRTDNGTLVAHVKGDQKQSPIQLVLSRSEACSILWTLVVSPAKRQSLSDAGVLQPLVDLLVKGPLEAKHQAAGALALFLGDGEDQRELALQFGVMPELARCLGKGSDGARACAAQALGALCTRPEVAGKVLHCGGVQSLCELLRTGSPQGQQEALGCLLAVLSAALPRQLEEVCSLVEGAGGHHDVLRMVPGEDTRADAVGCVAVLTGRPRGAEAVARAGGVVPVVALLRDPKAAGDDVTSSASACVHNMARASPEAARLVVAAGAVGPLVALLKHSLPGVKELAAGSLWAVAAADERCRADAVAAGAIKSLSAMINGKSVTPSLRFAATSCLRTLTNTNEQSVEQVGKMVPGVLARVYTLQKGVAEPAPERDLRELLGRAERPVLDPGKMEELIRAKK